MITVHQIRTLTEMLDGHGIFDGNQLSQKFPIDLIHPLITVHESGRDIKSIIFRNCPSCGLEEPVSSMKGVYGLNLLYKLANIVKADTSLAMELMGRGSQARALKEAIHKALENIDDNQSFEIDS